jgi:hypothetical protein
VFLNHGSFGVCPREVLEEQFRIRRELERDRSGSSNAFCGRRWPHALVRVSAHVYNRLDEYAQLAAALVAQLR